MDAYFDELIQTLLKKKLDKDKFAKLKVRLSKKHDLGYIPTDIEVMLKASEKNRAAVKRLLLTKPTRTVSGVAVVAIMPKPYDCPHTLRGVGPCTYCPGGPDSHFGSVPQAYTGKEPATRRAIRNQYDAYRQVFNRLEQYVVTGHAPEKVELIVMGGTFNTYPKKYKDEFVLDIYKAMNDFSTLFFPKGELNLDKFKRFFELPGDIYDANRSKNVVEKILKQKKKRMKTTIAREQTRNEKSAIRCVGMTFETRPDCITPYTANEMREYGVTRVELGIQSIYDDVLDTVKRGHYVKDAVMATGLLKDLGFKINYHMMLGLPGVTRKMDLVSLQTIIEDESFRPDMLKLYPCMVMKGTELYEDFVAGKYTPITTQKAASIISEFKRIVPKYIRIMRVQRDIPTNMTEAGVDKTNLRQYVEKELEKKGITCHCIRCREIGIVKKKIDVKHIEFTVLHYHASGGNEFFISAEYKDHILGFCRLRFVNQTLCKEITDSSALIRELHVYGSSVSIGKSGKVQHLGIGKKLVKMAQEIAEEYHKDKMVIISGIGAREYYANKLGYKKEGTYMVKHIA